MKEIMLHTDSKSTATCVPNAFIDNFMADANGEFVKIYLYLLRCMNSAEDFSLSQMADKFEHTEKDIARALKYWEKMHILKLEYDKENRLRGICILDSSKESAQEEDGADALVNSISGFMLDSEDIESVLPESDDMGHDPQEQNDMTSPEIYSQLINEVSSSVPSIDEVQIQTPSVEHDDIRPEYTRDEILKFQQDEDVQDLLFIAEKYIGRSLNPTDINAILFWHESLRFSMDLIEYLIEYCVDKGHRNIRYMDKVAIAWAESDIQTVEQAKKSAGMHSQTYYGVMKAFGISGRNLVEFEMEYIDKWTSSLGYSLDIIQEACKRTIQAIHQPSFEYTDTILGNWKKNQVHKIEDITVLDLAFQKTKAAKAAIPAARNPVTKGTAAKNRFTNYPQRSYDYAELEKQLLNSSK